MTRTGDPDCALIAIARNEGAYIAAFLFHHLRMGFAPIYIVTNGCTDDTVDIVERVAAGTGRVRRIDGDKLPSPPKTPRFQNVAYRHCLADLETCRGRTGFAAFLDIDEYWLPLDGSRSVSAFLQARPGIDQVLANWVAPASDLAPFTLALGVSDVRLAVNAQLHVKPIFRRSIKIAGLNPHRVQSDTAIRTLVLSGEALNENATSTASLPKEPGAAVIVHQMYRSQVEYLSSLLRGRPSQDRHLKNNRNGYRAGLTPKNRFAVPLARAFRDDWVDAYHDFVRQHDLAAPIRRSQIAVLERAEAVLDMSDGLEEDALAAYEKVLKNVDRTGVRRSIDILRKELEDPDAYCAARPVRTGYKRVAGESNVQDPSRGLKRTRGDFLGPARRLVHRLRSR